MEAAGQKVKYVVNAENFAKIPGSPVAYWASKNDYTIFENASNIESIAMPRQGLATGDNEKFLRKWYEVIFNDISLHCESVSQFHDTTNKYIPYNKGGSYRKWFGNIDAVIRFDKSNYDILSTVGNHLPSRDFYCKEAITWSKVSGELSMRYVERGAAFDVAGCSIFDIKGNLKYILGFCNSKITKRLISFFSETINFEVGTIKLLPLIVSLVCKSKIDRLVEESIEYSKADWDSFENSWDFKKHPLV